MANYRRSYLFRLGSDPVCSLWTGYGPLETPADHVDQQGARWSGAGELVGIPALQALINGRAGRYTFGLSGVSAETMRLAMEDRATVEGAVLRIGYVDFDAAWQVARVVWEWLGIADVLTVDSSPSAEGRTRLIALSVASSDTRRSNPQLGFFTAADQNRRSPTDRFCDQVASISQRVTRRFGPK
ncbi:hypothetical protein [Sphingomonas xinjiangensis]|uniref:Uncharacterized protein n=1 Tax=Sphingomonas xinjiangensis TaxID=643568 RepID=A0A840YNF5_9SPHN|nr:hypothetical protein [Sphingomonas xinjiangensis]MBB5709351.1 hypothetical protein [Sphingomonas xinjiangensis]